MNVDSRSANIVINVLALCAALLSVVGTGYIINHAFQARRAEDDTAALTMNAIAGDLDSRRTLASCYVDGCPPLPRSEIIACAWRKIIAEGPESGEDDRTRLHAVCDPLSASEQEISENAKASLQRRIQARRAAARAEP
ncbi:hypothetical protein VQ03_20195 [Methylobacterium tarhaniae]|uniref:Uncharacterized protein n=1 Tax=Methylobacterium tarhaniae TaxID=1187852 RepID=A0A0J6SN93_9HYPH|nr:hypothetical protein [Methylobacterium tarhaniae]KMO36685.1 hypothetical protein VQ03_20195 [Methylobacterium tarhaniae]